MATPTSITTNKIFNIPSMQCGECGVREGELHDPECEVEICALCGELENEGCECLYEIADAMGIDLDVDDDSLLTIDLEPAESELEKRRVEKGRVPFVYKPEMCVRCGMHWPASFHADDWHQVIPHPFKKEILCLECYVAIRSLFVKSRAAEVDES